MTNIKLQQTRLVELPEERKARSKVIACMNNKGGCGKTSTNLALGIYFARLGYNVLFWDNDPQSNLTQRLGVPNEQFKDRRLVTFFRLTEFEDFENRQKELILIAKYPYLYRAGSEEIGTIGIMAGHPYAEIEAAGTEQKLNHENFMDPEKKELHHRFRDAVNKYRNYFDYILIDTAPALEGSLLCKLALKSADEIICPIDGLEAAAGLKQLINWMHSQTTPTQGVIKKPNLLFALMKYQEDTVLLSDDTEGYPLKNAVYRALKDCLGNYVCDNGIKELQSLRNRAYTISDKRNQYTDLCNEIISKIHSPRQNFFDAWNINTSDKLIAKLTKIEEKAMTYKPQFKNPVYRNLKEQKSNVRLENR
jgi:cellulose biosynthesis protein BcsQ